MEGRRKESVNPAHGCPKKRNRKKENIWYCVLLEHSGRGAEFVCRQTWGIRGVSGGNIIFLSTLSQRNFPHSAHDTQTSHFHWLQSNWDMSFMAFQPNFRWLFSLSFESVVSGVDWRRRRFHKCLRGLSSYTVPRQRKLISQESGGESFSEGDGAARVPGRSERSVQWILRDFHSPHGSPYQNQNIWCVMLEVCHAWNGRGRRKNLHVTSSIHQMLQRKSLKWTWKVFLRGFSGGNCELKSGKLSSAAPDSADDSIVIEVQWIWCDFGRFPGYFNDFSPHFETKEKTFEKKFLHPPSRVCWWL